MINPLNGVQVRDAIIKKGYEATDVAAVFWGNASEALANTGKGILIAKCGRRVGSSAYKDNKNFSKSDVLCGTLCLILIKYEIACTVITWVSMPAIVPLRTLKI